MATTIETIEFWKELGTPPPTELTDARLQLHMAVQSIATVGNEIIEPDDDLGTHISMEWLDGPMLLSSRPFGEPLPIQLAVRTADLTLILQNFNTTELISALPLNGKTMKQTIGWLEETIAGCLGEERRKFKKPKWDLPEHPVAKGKKFNVEDTAAFEELARWIGNGYHAVQAVESVTKGATEVRFWPEKLDMNTIVRLDPSNKTDDSPRIRCGMCPGDATVEEPYFYVTPFPQPADATVPAIAPPARWHLMGWFGGVLTGTRLLTAPAEQPDCVAEFWTSGLESCRMLLDRIPSSKGPDQLG